MGAVENYLENCVHAKLDIEALERSMEPENEEVSPRYTLKYSAGRGSDIFRLLAQQRERTTSWQAEDDGWRVGVRMQHCREVGKMRHDIKYQGAMAKAPPCPERNLETPMPQQSSPLSREEESQWVAVKDRRSRGVAFEETAEDILRYLDNSEDLKVSVTELQEQLGMSEEAGTSVKHVTHQARNENGQHFCNVQARRTKRYTLPVGPDGTRS